MKSADVALFTTVFVARYSLPLSKKKNRHQRKNNLVFLWLWHVAKLFSMAAYSYSSGLPSMLLHGPWTGLTKRCFFSVKFFTKNLKFSFFEDHWKLEYQDLVRKIKNYRMESVLKWAVYYTLYDIRRLPNSPDLRYKSYKNLQLFLANSGNAHLDSAWLKSFYKFSDFSNSLSLNFANVEYLQQIFFSSYSTGRNLVLRRSSIYFSFWI